MLRRIQSHVFIFLTITALCLGGLGYVFVSKDSTISESDLSIDQTREIITQAQETLTLIYRTISIQRGYLLSADESMLVDYDANKAMLTETLARLKELTSRDAAQESRADELQHHYLMLVETLDSMIQKYKTDSNLTRMEDLEKVKESRKSLDRVASTILAESYETLNAYIQQLEKTKKSLYTQLSIGIVLASLALTFLNYYFLYIQGRRVSAEESLEEAEERLRLAIKGTNDGIYDWDIETKELYWSPQYKNLLGYEDHEIQASREMMDSLLHPDDREQLWEKTYKYLHRELSELSCVFRLKHKTGHWIWVSMRGKALFDEDGKAVRLIGTISDISKLKEYEAQLEEAKIHAEHANESKTEFLAHMSHEIRTPLTSISGVAEILLNQSKNFTDKQQQLIKVLNYSTTNLKELINDILDFSKIESGQLELEDKPFRLQDLFDEITGTMSIRAQEKGLRFTFNYQDVADTTFVGDKIRLRQILMNLIGNALKFTQEGSVEILAQKKDFDGTPALQIDVQDTGIGIDPENHALVFERFRQADPSVSRKYGGTGLGLPISKNLVESMGGRIMLESELGKGSLFTVLLPLRIAQTQDIGSPPPIRKTVVHQTRIGKKDVKSRVLLVEDYEGNIALLSYILETLGCPFDVARTGLEGLNLWKEHHHDLILMDVQMPEMDGLTATKKIRRMESELGLPRTPIIGMTAHAFVEDKDKCTAAGMDTYLAKPIAEKDLIAEISRHLEAKEARLERQASSAND
ncbi:MAG: ATP-binding protein [Micavibrio sp.]